MNALVGDYRMGDGPLLTVTRANTATDLLNWEIRTEDDGEAAAYGQAVLTKVPDSRLYLALLLDTVPLNGAEPIPTSIVILRPHGSDTFFEVAPDEHGLLEQVLGDIQDRQQEEAVILTFILKGSGAYAEGFVRSYVRISATPSPQTAPRGPAPGVSDGPDPQCAARVEGAMLYCREEWDIRGAGSVYYIECNSHQRSENRACRGWYRNETSYPNTGFRPYYCDPETGTRAPSPEDLVGSLCR